MKAAAAFLLLAAAFQFQCTLAQFFGVGISGFKTVSLQPVQTVAVPYATKKTLTATSLPPTVPLAPGLSLSGSTAYTKASPVPASDCLTTSLDLFTNCQPFLQDIIDNGGQLNKITILQLLVTAQNKTTSSACFSATLNFLNKGCTCDLTTYNTLQALPTSQVPQLLKTSTDILAQKLCPSGLINPGPPPSSGDSSSNDATASSGTSTSAAAPATGLSGAG